MHRPPTQTHGRDSVRSEWHAAAEGAPAHQRVASAENQKGALPSRPRPRTSDHATQCDDLLLGVPPLVKLEPRSTEVAADSTVDVADQSSGVAGVIAGAPTPHPTAVQTPTPTSITCRNGVTDETETDTDCG